ncbi:hypothetical protein AUR64_17325 [Haloprofundus marisrubri]|uniref:Uncharacterized protein n=1 Tax=Haloprofundus marisrubri TaxID=1514971 RepID=A0A0W1R827_9EURY|nr:hypothetical protein [Haloprofundus marisrubri]KTG09528.1 hypothetical protein AUR64_17325 [Haloprofundus marisrubri]
MMWEIIHLLVVGVVGCFFIGYMTPKAAIWGSITTIIAWLCFHLVPGADPAMVLNALIPRIADLFFVFPRAVGLASDSMGAEAGLIGVLAVLVWAVILIVPYVVGMILGVLTWPELIFLRLLL